MSDPSAPSPPPPTVRAAAAVVCAQGAIAVLFAAALVWRAFDGAFDRDSTLGQAAYYAILGAGVLGVGIALLRGFRGARTPAFVVQVILLGVAYYAAIPSGRPEWGVPIGLVCAAVVVGLLSGPAKAWADDDPPGPAGGSSGDPDGSSGGPDDGRDGGAGRARQR